MFPQMKTCRHYVIVALLLCLFLQCFAQQQDTNHAPCIYIDGVRLTESDIDLMTADSPDTLPFYQVEGVFTIENIREYGEVYLIDVVMDSIISEEPPKWIENHYHQPNSLMTIVCWKEAKYLKSYQLVKRQKIACSLRSVYPIRFVGHGEDYVHVQNQSSDNPIPKNEFIPFSQFLGMLMEFVSDTLLILD